MPIGEFSAHEIVEALAAVKLADDRADAVERRGVFEDRKLAAFAIEF